MNASYNKIVHNKDVIIIFPVINAISNVFPGADLTGCLFHLAKNLYKKVVELGHKVTYEMSSEFNQCIKFFTALAFLPPSDFLGASVTTADLRW